ncbi:MAG: 5'-nucleotidase C-terminal domain-containing protein, partial [Bacteroidota bacterium]
RAYLENSARYYNKYQPGTPAINPQWRAYNYDMVSGVDYQFDLSKPEGSRVTKLSFKGKPVQDGQTFTMAINSYRQRGGGGYEMIKDAPVVYNKEEGIRETIIDFLKKKKTIKPSEVFKKNWHLLGGIDPEQRLFQ